MTGRRMMVMAAAAACVAAGGPAWADGGKGTGVIKGVVKLEGEAPKPVALKMDKDANCAKMHDKPVWSPDLIVFSDGTLPYVFVYIKSGISEKYDPPKEPAVIDQSGCMYKPHVFGMVAGQALKIINSDDTAHNIHAMPKKNTEFNFGQPKKGMETVREGTDTFTKEEVMIHIKCDVHPWMSAFCGVLNHPFFAVTGKGGKFEIKDLPAGEYEVEAWHEKWGKTTGKVTVGDGEAKELNLTFSKKKAAAEPAPREVLVSATESSGGSCCAKKAGGACDGKAKPAAVAAAQR